MDIWAHLNDRADELAGSYRVFIESQEVTTFPSPKMCLEDVCIYHRDKKLINIDRNNLYNFIQWGE